MQIDTEETHDKEWYKQCRFDCRACENKQQSPGGLNNHIKRAHDINEHEYIETYGPLMTIKKTHRCRICGDDLLSMRNVIGDHVLMHELSLNEYSSKYLGVEIGDEADVKSYNERAIDNTFEQCEYTCGICEEKFQVDYRLWTHVGKAHKDVTLRDYKDKYGLCRTKTVMHRCRICEKELLHTKGKISTHLWNKHSLSTTGYKEKYLADSDAADAIDDEGSHGTVVLTVPWDGSSKDEEVSESGQVEEKPDEY